MEPHLQGIEVEPARRRERAGRGGAERYHAPGRPVFNRSVTLRDTWAAKAGG